MSGCQWSPPHQGVGVVMVMIPPVGCGVDSGGAHRIYRGWAPPMGRCPPLPVGVVWRYMARGLHICMHAMQPYVAADMPCAYMLACIRNACIRRCGYVNAYTHAIECICRHMPIYIYIHI